ncbi:bcl-2-binding component 3 [Marmota marmota marmota]|uniref:bcl-2-binding component 3 n=1 Tax=Marmota marmota marmota TaxID=9994 RepID=UPI002092C8CF|nr:bcl-2-binding component 3 [Marmota marmota marmota]
MWASCPRPPQSTLTPPPPSARYPARACSDSPHVGLQAPPSPGALPAPSPGHLSRRPRGVRDSGSVGLRVRSSRAALVTSRTHHVKRGNKEGHFRYYQPVSGSLKEAAPPRVEAERPAAPRGPAPRPQRRGLPQIRAGAAAANELARRLREPGRLCPPGIGHAFPLATAAETRGTAATPPLTLEGLVQSHHGTPALTQGPWSPRNGAQLGACTRPVDVGDLEGRTLPPPDALASAGDFFCTM